MERRSVKNVNKGGAVMAKFSKRSWKLIRKFVILMLIAMIITGTTYGFEENKSKTNEFMDRYEKPSINEPKETKPDVSEPGGSETKIYDPDDPLSNLDDGDTPRGGRDPDPDIPGGVPKTGDEANPRLWLIVLAVSTFILRRELFFRKKVEKIEN